MVFARVWQPAAARRSSTVAARKGAPVSARNRSAAARSASIGFQRDQRLTKSAEFGRVFAGAARSSDRYFTVLARQGTTAVARLGLTMSRRTAKRAVDRNKLKRVARESFRHHRLPAWDFIVISKAGAAAADARTLRQSLDTHFERLTARAAST